MQNFICEIRECLSTHSVSDRLLIQIVKWSKIHLEKI